MAERAEQQTALDTQRGRGRPAESVTARRRSVDRISRAALAAAVVAALATYALFAVHPWPHGSLSEFLATFGRNNAAVWPMQLIWCAGAVAMVGLALWPQRSLRHSTELICLLVAAYFAWEGIAYFAALNSGMNLAGLWAAVFTLEGILFLIAGRVRHDLVIAPRWDAASVLGALFIGYALIAYPLIGMVGGHPLSTLPVFGLSPCATVVFCFGLLLWARPPAPLYLLPLPLAWAFGAAPSALGTGVVVDVGMVVGGVIATLIILWRDRTSTTQTVLAAGALTLMIAWSGHQDVLMGLALVLVAVTLARTIRGAAPPDGQGQEIGTPPSPNQSVLPTAAHHA